MPRHPRIEAAGAIYHLTARGNGGTAIFLDDFDRVHFLDLIVRAGQRFRWRCFAYCLMSNHYHVLVQTLEPNLSSGMRVIQTRYACRFNRRHGRHGHLFGDRFHDELVKSEQHLLAAAVYIVRNPVRAGLVATPGAWPWSSYHAMVDESAARGPVDAGALLQMLSPDPERARRIFQELADASGALMTDMAISAS